MTMTDPRALDYLERIADSLADIADALTRNRAARTTWTPDAETPGTIEHGATTSCIHGEAHSDDLECEYACTATTPGHRCTRLEHVEGGHLWAMTDAEAERIIRAGQELGFVAEADPLDEDDHRPRHDRDGDHWRWHTDGWYLDDGAGIAHELRILAVTAQVAPLTFCDCETDHA